MLKTCIVALSILCCADGFSNPVPYISKHNYRQRSSTRLNEQPTNIKKLLGPISPSTLAKYNLPPDVLSQGLWSAEIVTLTAKSLDEGTSVQLAPKISNEHYIDTVQVKVPIPSLDSPGLGIELLELEGGGREDGLGIVIVNGLVPGGNAERAVSDAISISKQKGKEEGETIMYGDSIVSAELILQRSAGSFNREQTDVTLVRTECLGYDSTVDALVGMLSSLDSNDQSIQEASVMLTLKRLRRRPNIQVKVQYPPSQDLPSETLQLQPGENLRMALLTRGIKLNDPLAQRYDGKASGGNCGGAAICRTCAVSVLRGGELLSQPKLNEKTMMEKTQNISRMRLSCKSWVGYGMKEGEIVIQVNPRQW